MNRKCGSKVKLPVDSPGIMASKITNTLSSWPLRCDRDRRISAEVKGRQRSNADDLRRTRWQAAAKTFSAFRFCQRQPDLCSLNTTPPASIHPRASGALPRILLQPSPTVSKSEPLFSLFYSRATNTLVIPSTATRARRKTPTPIYSPTPTTAPLRHSLRIKHRYLRHVHFNTRNNYTSHRKLVSEIAVTSDFAFSCLARRQLPVCANCRYDASQPCAVIGVTFRSFFVALDKLFSLFIHHNNKSTRYKSSCFKDSLAMAMLGPSSTTSRQGPSSPTSNNSSR